MRISPPHLRMALILTGMLAASALGLSWPQHRREQVLRQRLSAAQSSMQTDRSAVLNLAGLAEQVVQLQATLERARRSVPAEDELAELLRRVSTLMNEYGLAEQQVQTRTMLRGIEYSALPMRVDFRGSFPQVYSFLNQAESSRHILRTVRLEITSGRRPGEPLTGAMELVAFFQPQAQVTP